MPSLVISASGGHGLSSIGLVVASLGLEGARRQAQTGHFPPSPHLPISATGTDMGVRSTCAQYADICSSASHRWRSGARVPSPIGPSSSQLLLPCCSIAAAFCSLAQPLFRFSDSSCFVPSKLPTTRSLMRPVLSPFAHFTSTLPYSLPPKSRNVRPPGCHHLRETCLHQIDNNPSTYSLHEPQTTSSDSVHLSCIHHSHGWNLVPCSLSPGSTEQSTSEHPQTTA